MLYFDCFVWYRHFFNLLLKMWFLNQIKKAPVHWRKTWIILCLPISFERSIICPIFTNLLMSVFNHTVRRRAETPHMHHRSNKSLIWTKASSYRCEGDETLWKVKCDVIYMWPWSTKPVWVAGYICSNSQKTLHGSKYEFFFYAKNH